MAKSKAWGIVKACIEGYPTKEVFTNVLCPTCKNKTFNATDTVVGEMGVTYLECTACGNTQMFADNDKLKFDVIVSKAEKEENTLFTEKELKLAKSGYDDAKVTKVFFDTEFTGLHKNTTLISIGLVAESGETFYAELKNYDRKQVDSWVIEHVINNTYFLKETPSQFMCTKAMEDYFCVLDSKVELAKDLRMWLAQFEKVEMVSDCLAYDFVLFCDIWNNAFGVPENVYYIPFDICTMFKMKGVDPDINREEFAEVSDKDSKHNALHDAIIIQKCFEKLMQM